MNWHTDSLDIMCMTLAQEIILPTSYFFGFAIGGFFFWLPDKFGRKLTMNAFMIPFMVASTVSTCCPNY